MSKSIDKKETHAGQPTKIKLDNGEEVFEVDRFGAGGAKLSPAMIYLCTFLYTLWPVASPMAALILLCLLFTNYWFITIAYVLYIIYNRSQREKGGHRIQANFNSMFWKYLAAYFPVKLRYPSSFKLDPKQNYLVNYGPHGISAFGAVSVFATNALDLTSLFPGIEQRLMVHEMVFVTPYTREFYAYRGDCCVNAKSIDYMFNVSKSGTGNLIAIITGGLPEAEYSDPRVMRIMITQKKGFIKKALVNGANLIPAIAFGENSVFTKVNLKPSSSMYPFLSKLSNMFLGMKQPLFYGLLSMPFKRPITVVMANPIQVDKVVSPSQEQIDSLHERYVKELKKLYEAHHDLRTHYDTKLELL